MRRPTARMRTVVLLLLAAAVSASCGSYSTAFPRHDHRLGSQAEADVLRETERERVRSLVDADVEIARRLHADDFQLINPFGGTLSKEQYLGSIASGEVDYLAWDPESIEVRLYGHGAIIRYRSHLEIVVRGQKIPLRQYWHTDSYEKRDGRWQVVWSHATEIK